MDVRHLEEHPDDFERIEEIFQELGDFGKYLRSFPEDTQEFIRSMEKKGFFIFEEGETPRDTIVRSVDIY